MDSSDIAFSAMCLITVVGMVTTVWILREAFSAWIRGTDVDD